MRKYFRIYKPFIDAGMQETVTYRSNWIFMMLGNVLGCFVSYFIWKAVFLSSDQESLMGFTMPDMMVYIFLMTLTATLISTGGTYDVGDEIKDGSIAMRIIKPVSYNATFLFQEIGNKCMTIGLLILPTVLGIELFRTFVMGEVHFRLFNFIVYLFSCTVAYLINFFFNICYGFTAFVFQNLWGSNMLKNCIVGFLSGSLIPLAFFPKGLEQVFLFLPFASLNYTPVMIYMGKYTGKTLLFYLVLQIVWCLFFWALSKMIWKIVISHLCVQGG